MCHSQPTIGGTSPGPGTPGFTVNPEISVATLNGATNPEDLSAFHHTQWTDPGSSLHSQ